MLVATAVIVQVVWTVVDATSVAMALEALAEKCEKVVLFVF